MQKRKAESVPMDRTSSTPLYHQLADRVRTGILENVYAPGTALPSERDMMAQFNLSRVAVRLAIDVLAREGLIVRRRGKGTYVSQPRVKHELDRTMMHNGFYDVLVKQGKNARVELGDFRTTAPSMHAGTLLPYESVVYLERAFIADNETMIVAFSDLHPRAKTVSREEAQANLNYELLTELLGFTVARTDIAIRSALPTKRIAEALAIGEEEPVLILRRATFAVGDIPIERTDFYVRSERYEFAFTIREGNAVDQTIRPLSPRAKSRGHHRPGQSAATAQQRKSR